MKKIICISLLFNFLLNCETIKNHEINPEVTGKGFVHVENGKLVDERNAPLKLKTINIGGWLLWEGWIWGGGFSKETDIFERIKNKTSTAFAENFRNSVYNNWVTHADLQRMKEIGFTTVCITFNHRVLDNGVNGGPVIQENFAVLDNMINLCRRNNLRVIIEMHAAPG